MDDLARLPESIRKQVALAAASRADYCVAVHATLAGKFGAAADVVEALRNGGALKDAKLEVVRPFAAAIASERTQVFRQRRERADGGRAMTAARLSQ